MKNFKIKALVACTAFLAVSAVSEMKHNMDEMNMHEKHMLIMKKHSEGETSSLPTSMPQDTRQLVIFPRKAYDKTLANMRKHLKGISEVNRLVGEGKYEEAALAAEKGMGMGNNHGGHGGGERHRHMPEGMKAMGAAMHNAASDLATLLRETEVTNDLPSVFTALNKVTSNCVACHDAYRLQPKD